MVHYDVDVKRGGDGKRGNERDGERMILNCEQEGAIKTMYICLLFMQTERESERARARERERGEII